MQLQSNTNILSISAVSDFQSSLSPQQRAEEMLWLHFWGALPHYFIMLGVKEIS